MKLTYPKANEGESGKFDLVILKKENKTFKRVCLIEFKANDSNEHNHKKDFVKLHNSKEGDQSVLRYFIEIFSNPKENSKQPENNTIEKFKENIRLKEKDGNDYYYPDEEEYKILMPVEAICIFWRKDEKKFVKVLNLTCK